MVRHRLAPASHVSPPKLSTPRPPAGSFFIPGRFLSPRRLESWLNAADDFDASGRKGRIGRRRALSPPSRSPFPRAAPPSMPDDFVYLRDVDPSIRQDMRYAGSDNFTGAPVPGYEAAECVLVRQAAEALKAVQADIKPKGLTLAGLRLLSPDTQPSRPSLPGPRRRTIQPPKRSIIRILSKADLFPDYIATRSGHSRGATLDLTDRADRRRGDASARNQLPAPRKGHAPGRQPRHGHELRLLRREGQHGHRA